eukprot:4502936-Ditylum_brightwellii.AAC.1
MVLISNIPDNKDIEYNEETDNISIVTTETYDESTTSDQQQTPMQPHGMNVNLPIPYISTSEQLHYNRPLL